jgi:hypothetical protein
VLARYREPADRYPGTGGELAEHLLERLGIDGVKVEKSDSGDHYDPSERAVRLIPDHLHGRSLTAVTVAAHEVGHALQHHQGYRPLGLRTRMVTLAARAERTGAMFMVAVPVVGLFTRSPVLSLVVFGAGMASMVMATVVHFVTLPVEWDASFKRALPLLRSGTYLQRGDERHARRILTACALTYVAASLSSLLNLGRWIAFLKR